MDLENQSCDSEIFRFGANLACAENWEFSRSLVRSRVNPNNCRYDEKPLLSLSDTAGPL